MHQELFHEIHAEMLLSKVRASENRGQEVSSSAFGACLLACLTPSHAQLTTLLTRSGVRRASGKLVSLSEMQTWMRLSYRFQVAKENRVMLVGVWWTHRSGARAEQRQVPVTNVLGRSLDHASVLPMHSFLPSSLPISLQPTSFSIHTIFPG